jgi:hypothetical protein
MTVSRQVMLSDILPMLHASIFLCIVSTCYELEEKVKVDSCVRTPYFSGQGRYIMRNFQST